MESTKEFDVGSTYLLKTQKEATSFELFRSLTKDRPGLCITSKNPTRIKEKYDLDLVKFGHLSTSEDPNTIGPNELNLLGVTIKKFVSEERGVVLFDGIDYLLAKNDTSKVIRFIQSIQDRISSGTSIMLIVLNTAEIDEKYVQSLENQLDMEVKSLKETAEEKDKSPQKGEYLVSQVRNMMEFLKEQEDYIESEEEKIDQKTPSGFSDFVELESLKDEIEALREENRALKNELENIKSESEEEGKDEVFEKEIVDEVVATVEEEKKDVEEQMEKIETKDEKKFQKPERSPALMGTLLKLEEEIRSLKDEVKTIKKESPKKEIKEEKEKRETQKEIDTKTEKEETDMVDSDLTSDLEPELDHEVIQEPKLEDEFLTEEKESVEELEEELTEESEKKISDDKVIYDEDKIKLKSGSKIFEDIESKGEIKVEKGVTLKGSLKSERDIDVDENSLINGEIISKSGDVKIGKDCKITGKISGKIVSISERSKVEDIEAKEEVTLENNTRVRNILCQKDVNIFENVEIDGGIDYGGQLDLNGEYINIRGRIRPIDEEEVVKEKWV